MNINPGEFVTVSAGKEKGKCFVVLSVENQFLYLCDGKNRKVNNPKKKKIKHVEPAGLSADLPDGSVTDKILRKAISDFGRRFTAENDKTE